MLTVVGFLPLGGFFQCFPLQYFQGHHDQVTFNKKKRHKKKKNLQVYPTATLGLNLNTDMDIESRIALQPFSVPFGISQFCLFTSKNLTLLDQLIFQVFIISCHVLTLADSACVKDLCYSTRLFILQWQKWSC